MIFRFSEEFPHHDRIFHIIYIGCSNLSIPNPIVPTIGSTAVQDIQNLVMSGVSGTAKGWLRRKIFRVPFPQRGGDSTKGDTPRPVSDHRAVTGWTKRRIFSDVSWFYRVFYSLPYVSRIIIHSCKTAELFRRHLFVLSKVLFLQTSKQYLFIPAK